jgi:mRNA interferase MazF
VKACPFETPLPDGLEIAGVVLSDRVGSLDWRARDASPAGTAPSAVVDEVLAKLATVPG